MGAVYLASLPFLDVDYENVIDFESENSQISFFNSKVVSAINVNTRIDSEKQTLTIEKKLYDLDKIDYLMLNDNNKWYYYFVIEKRYKTESHSTLYLSLDVFSTYLFDYKILDSFVDRCHVPRWGYNNKPTPEFYAEDIQIGEKHSKERISVYNYEARGSYILASTEPLGKCERRKGTGGDTDLCWDWEQGESSADGFRFMKGFEGFGKYSYKDSEGIDTIGYGVARHANPDLWEELNSIAPLEEEYAARISYDLKTQNYGLPIVESVKNLGCTSQNQFDALLDLAFNSGVGSIIESNVLTEIIKKDITDEVSIRNVWENYKTNGGILTSRRVAECDIFFDSLYEKRPIVTINKDGSYGKPVEENNGNGWIPSCSSEETGDFENEHGIGWLYPTSGTITATFPSYPSGKPHTGIDFGNSVGTNVYASKDGIVIDKQEILTSYGFHYKIKHGDVVGIYAHNSKLIVNLGDNVKKGQLIALSGNTGNSTGSHLHFELRYNDVAFNPIPNLKIGDIVR